MTTLAEMLLEHGIRLRNYAAGSYKTTCPRCSHGRRNKTEPCLSTTVDASGDGAVWHCHHCGWTGGVNMREREDQAYRPPRRPTQVKPSREPESVTPAILAWFAERGISEAVVRRNKIGAARAWLPGIGAEVDAIAFPYHRSGELVNVKFRGIESKAFAQVKGAEKILYGLDDIADSKTAIIVEGEIDKLALEEAGIRNAVSVPDGAPKAVKSGAPDPADAKFEYLTNCAAYLEPLERIVLAVDADGPGQALEEELARRLGRERCWRVRWPDSGDAPCKDANEVLRIHGPQVVAECIANAEPYPIAGLHSISDFGYETLALYRDGHKRGHSTGWSSLDELMTIRPGELTVVTGIPNSGKSEIIDALMVNLAQRYGWRFGVCSFENPPAEHIAKLAEKYLGLPFWDGPTSRMSETELRQAMEWVADHFVLIRADDEAPTIDWILTAARGAVLRHGIRGLVIDPYNEIEHRRSASQTETEYVSQLLGKVKRFAQAYGVHVWFVAHPAKLHRENDGALPVPTLYDISGSANWANKADIGLVVHRDPNRDPTRTDIFVRKVRFKQVGKIGTTSLRYDRATGRYFEVPTAGSVGKPKAYADD
jgi:twinkle protein